MHNNVFHVQLVQFNLKLDNQYVRIVLQVHISLHQVVQYVKHVQLVLFHLTMVHPLVLHVMLVHPKLNLVKCHVQLVHLVNSVLLLVL